MSDILIKQSDAIKAIDDCFKLIARNRVIAEKAIKKIQPAMYVDKNMSGKVGIAIYQETSFILAEMAQNSNKSICELVDRAVKEYYGKGVDDDSTSNNRHFAD